jgi:hypothetical protein
LSRLDFSTGWEERERERERERETEREREREHESALGYLKAFSSRIAFLCYCCAGERYTVAFTKVLTICQIFHT